MDQLVKRYLMIGILIIAILGLLVFASKFFRKTAAQPEQTATTIKKNPKTKGPQDAPIIIMEFSDYQCPACAAAEEPLKELLVQFPELVQVHFHHFPLQMHPHANDASNSAECAAKQSKFWEYHTLLFKEQQIWSRDPDPKTLFNAYANTVGLNQQDYEACLKNPEIQSVIDTDRRLGERLEVRSTPTFFINGERAVGSKQLSESGPVIIRKQLDQMVKAKSKP